MDRADLEKCVCQLLMGGGLVSDADLKHQLRILNKQQEILDLPVYFGSINQKLRALSLEIKSIQVGDDRNSRVVLHGIVNTEEDFVSKKWGTY
jgi:hypothetical protein